MKVDLCEIKEAAKLKLVERIKTVIKKRFHRRYNHIDSSNSLRFYESRRHLPYTTQVNK